MVVVAAVSHFDASQPRGKDGRWIEIGGLIEIVGGLFDGKRGTVKSWDDQGRINVELHAGQNVRVKPDHIIQAPEKARLDVGMPSAPDAPSVALTDAEAADHLYEQSKFHTYEDSALIEDYTGGAFGDVNEWLRNEMSFEPSRENAVEVADAMDRNMKPLDVAVQTHRWADRDILWGKNPQDLVGKTITDDAFMSTTIYPAPPDNPDRSHAYASFEYVHFEIHVPEGHNALYVGANGDGTEDVGLSHYPEEYELILQRGTGIRVISATEDGEGNLVIVGEAVPPTSVPPVKA